MHPCNRYQRHKHGGRAIHDRNSGLVFQRHRLHRCSTHCLVHRHARHADLDHRSASRQSRGITRPSRNPLVKSLVSHRANEWPGNSCLSDHHIQTDGTFTCATGIRDRRRSNTTSRLDKSWTTHKGIRRSFRAHTGMEWFTRGTSCRFMASSHHFRSSPTLLPHLFFPELWTIKPSDNTVLTRTPMISDSARRMSRGTSCFVSGHGFIRKHRRQPADTAS